MNIIIKLLLGSALGAGIFVLAAAVAGPRAFAVPPGAATEVFRRGAVQTDDGAGGVTVAASFEKRGGETVFLVALDSHTADVDGYAPDRLITLEDGDGKSRVPRVLESEGENHHKRFVLAFPQARGPFTLVIRDLAGVERRELVWQE